MSNFSVIYFKSEILNAFVLISYSYLKSNRKIILNAIKFINKKTDLLKYIQQNNLKLPKEKDTIEENIIKNLIVLIKNYFSGKKVELYEGVKHLNINLELDEKFPTEFSQKVINYLIKSVTYGKLTSYWEIGENIGSKAYRAIGNVLKKNPLPIIIPCHRVINKSGKIGGFMGKINNEWQQNLKPKLLNIEGFKNLQI